MRLLAILWLALAATSADPIPDPEPDYEEALRLSLLFFEAQKSGKLPTTSRIRWRGDSALGDRGSDGEDLTGGYYDANDFVKFSYTMAFTTTILSWGVILYRDAYTKSGLYVEVLDVIKWSTDYFVKCHVAPEEFYGQVGDFAIDHSFWGRPEDLNMSRPAYKIDSEHPGTDLAGEASAAFSSASIIFSKVNTTYATDLLRHAKELYNFANKHKGFYHDVIPGAKEFYRSTSYLDELIWSSIWLYKATGDKTYLIKALEFYEQVQPSEEQNNTFFFDNKLVGIQLLLYQATGSEEFLSAIKTFCDHNLSRDQRTPKGLIFADKFGTLGHAAYIAFVCLQAAKLFETPNEDYLQLSKEQIDYMLGSTGRSFVIGYGKNYPKQPYHSASSCPARPSPCGWETFNSTKPNPQILYGALVSGPDNNDHYEDKRDEFIYNEVTLDYNAGFQSALAGLIQLKDQRSVDPL